MASFSERIGVRQPKAIQSHDMDQELRNSLWNVCRLYFFTHLHLFDPLKTSSLYPIALSIYENFYKLPVDELPYEIGDFISRQLNFFKKGDWFRVYEAIEFLSLYVEVDKEKFHKDINYILEREISAYRLISGTFVPVTNVQEIAQLEQAMSQTDRFSPVATHIRSALELLGKKPQPDYRNSIKESISAVESAAKIITGLERATLDEALKKISETHPIHGAFKEGVRKLYGYTSDEGGIRHALIDETNIDDADARFMLVSCSAFANYLIARCKS
ncbi:hypothetical protein V3H18_13515 [Methylocystis sp. 9N]|uniref:HEPN AbiJ-N-terminal domain-containing protein n=1 Tax=Methylocystis borbori TaxID=3118750 RepID=A0ABU7XLX9_9HYPH